jgi:hypothetical protein
MEKTQLAKVHAVSPDTYKVACVGRPNDYFRTLGEAQEFAAKLNAHFKPLLEAADAAPKTRSYKIAALTKDGATISTQIYNTDFAKAKATVFGWQADAKANGDPELLHAVIYCHQTQATYELF